MGKSNNRMPPLRTIWISVRVTPEERDRLDRRARAGGRTVSAFLREAALGRAPRARPGLVGREVIFLLSRLGLHLDRLGEELGGLGPEEIRERIGVARKLLQAILEELAR